MPEPGYQNAFIDCIRVVVRCPHDTPIGGYINIGVKNNGDGEIFRESASYADVLGPHGHALVRTYDLTGRQSLDIKFCPGKYFQGHNAFASGNLVGLVVAGVRDVVERLGLTLPEEEMARLLAGDVDLHEVHCTAMIDLGSESAVENALYYIYRGRHQRLRGPGKHEGTPTFGTGGSHQLKFYNKHREMSTGDRWGENYADGLRDGVFDWTLGKLRVEVCLKRRKLRKLGLQKASSWSEETPGRIVREQLELMRVNETAGLSPEAENRLTSAEYRVYQAWKSGADWKRMFKSSTSRKNYRRRLLKLGIDISVPYQNGVSSNKGQQDVVPFVEIIERDFSPVPGFALGKEVYVEPEDDAKE
ncbi:MAG: phage/plasmid replication protein, II/X family [Actinomycetia bacterium]|nr:phage/plasmid replication protein, II/X family [Actinomycetes bacterium]